MSDDKIELPIDFDIAPAVKDLQKLQSEMDSRLGDMEKDLNKLKTAGINIGSAIKAVAAGFSAYKIADFLMDGIKAAAESEAALAKLGNQLKINGEFSQAALNSFAEFADEMERTTNVGDDVVLSQAAIAKAFGLTDQETKDLIKAATDLSYVYDQDLSTSVDQLLKSYNGQTKSLEKSIPLVKELTKEELAQGKAIDAVSKAIGGQAAASLNTYAGSIKAAEIAYGNMGKEIGKLIINNQAVVDTIRLVADTLNQMTDGLKTSGSAVDTLIDSLLLLPQIFLEIGSFGDRFFVSPIIFGLTKINEAAGEVTDAYYRLRESFAGQSDETVNLRRRLEELRQENKKLQETAKESILEGKNAFGKLADKIGEVRNKTKELAKTVDDSAKDMEASTRKRKIFDADQIEKAREEYRKLSSEIVKSASDETQKVNLKRTEQIELIKKLGREAQVSSADISEKIVKINAAADREITDIKFKEMEKRIQAQKEAKNESEKLAKESVDYVKKLMAEAAENPVQVLFKAAFSGGIVSGAELGAAGTALATSFISALQKGKDGAREFGSKIAEGVGNTLDRAIGDDFLFGLGGLFKELFAFTSQSSEDMQKQIKEFITAIPQLFENLASSGPAIAEGFIDVILNTDFVYKLVQAVWRSPGLEYVGKKIGISSAGSFKEVVGGFFVNLWEQIKNSFIGDFGLQIGAIFTNISKGFETFFNGIADSVLGQGLTNIAQAFGDGIAQFGQSVGNFLQSFVDGIGRFFSGLSDFLKNLKDGLIQGFENFGIMLRDAFQKLIDGIKGIGGGVADAGKKAGGFLGDLLPGFASGGTVPPGYPNDTYPALLTSGEKIVPEGRPLPSDDGSNKIMISLLTKIMQMLDRPQTVTATADFNGRALADIILNLNRGNARLA